MALVKLSRKRFLGPGVKNFTLLPLGRLRVYSKSLRRDVVDQTYTATQQYGLGKVTWDNVHQIYRRFKRDYGRFEIRNLPESDEGGDFSSMHVYDWSDLKGKAVYRTEDSSAITTYDGGFRPDSWPINYFTSNDLINLGVSGKFTGDFGSAAAQGPKAWNKFKPKVYVADLGQFFGEIREALPMLQTTATLFGREFKSAFSTRTLKRHMTMSKQVANQWLNLQFGYTPFVSDLCKFFFTIEDFSTRLQQCIRDNGQWIRRRGVVETTWDNPSVPLNLYSNCMPGYPGYVIPGTLPNGLLNDGSRAGRDIYANASYTEKYHTWFAGCFRYWIPAFEEPIKAFNRVKNLMRMYGLQASPLLWWQLTPWSWLIDWVGNIGDNISNYSAITDQKLVAKYAYIMKTLTGELKIQATVRCGGTLTSVPQQFSWRRGFVVKTRRHANPYGFSIEPPNFSVSQWSILAALGLSRLKIETKRG